MILLNYALALASASMAGHLFQSGQWAWASANVAIAAIYIRRTAAL